MSDLNMNHCRIRNDLLLLVSLLHDSSKQISSKLLFRSWHVLCTFYALSSNRAPNLPESQRPNTSTQSTTLVTPSTRQHSFAALPTHYFVNASGKLRCPRKRPFLAQHCHTHAPDRRLPKRSPACPRDRSNNRPDELDVAIRRRAPSGGTRKSYSQRQACS
jgi:hypothetical protein